MTEHTDMMQDRRIREAEYEATYGAYDRAVMEARRRLGPTNHGDPGWPEFAALVVELEAQYKEEQ